MKYSHITLRDELRCHTKRWYNIIFLACYVLQTMNYCLVLAWLATGYNSHLVNQGSKFMDISIPIYRWFVFEQFREKWVQSRWHKTSLGIIIHGHQIKMNMRSMFSSLVLLLKWIGKISLPEWVFAWFLGTRILSLDSCQEFSGEETCLGLLTTLVYG